MYYGKQMLIQDSLIQMKVMITKGNMKVINKQAQEKILMRKETNKQIMLNQLKNKED